MPKSKIDKYLLMTSLVSGSFFLLGLFSITKDLPIGMVSLFQCGLLTGIVASAACWVCLVSGVSIRGGTAILSHLALAANLIPWVFLVLAIGFFSSFSLQ